MKQFAVTYVNWKDRTVVEYLTAENIDEARKNAEVIQGLIEIISVEEMK